jgi:hypothetical protein
MQKTRLFAVKLWENIREHEFDKLLSIISTEKYNDPRNLDRQTS